MVPARSRRHGELQAALGVGPVTYVVTCAGSAVARLAARPVCSPVGRAIRWRSGSDVAATPSLEEGPTEAEMGGRVRDVGSDCQDWSVTPWSAPSTGSRGTREGPWRKPDPPAPRPRRGFPERTFGRAFLRYVFSDTRTSRLVADAVGGRAPTRGTGGRPPCASQFGRRTLPQSRESEKRVSSGQRHSDLLDLGPWVTNLGPSG